LFSLNVEERNAVIVRIREWSSANSFNPADHRALTHDELLQLANSVLVDIGSHTRTHPMLHGLSIEKQKDEIGTSRKQLEAILKRPVLGFSYPNGTFSAQTQQVVQEAGYLYACMSDSGLARNPGKMYQLPRLWPKDWSGGQFLKYLKLWLSI
jgi:peptidoglycan/xylan/chitin deacetylase (PgdA/CDA1 family)